MNDRHEPVVGEAVEPEMQKPFNRLIDLNVGLDSKAASSKMPLEEKPIQMDRTIIAPAAREEQRADEESHVLRFSRIFRFQHILLFTSCIILIITGLPLKFSDNKISELFFAIIGGLQVGRIVHRIGASVLIFVGVFHILYTIFLKDGRKNFYAFIPAPKDIKDVYLNVMYFLGFRDDPPRFDRFSYLEKFDYWAVYWGMVVMILSGLLLWFNNISLALLPKFFIDIAYEAHSDEALLATLAITIWHFYNVHFNPDRLPMSWTWWHGKLSKEEMIKHHPLEYERMLNEKEETRNQIEQEGEKTE